MLHIVFYHHEVIPPIAYGGTERVIYWLTQGLLELGHKVTLLAAPGSKISGADIIPIESREKWQELIPKNADLLHLWNTPNSQELNSIRLPLLITIGGNGKPGEIFHLNTVFVSQSHAKRHGSENFVHNGININEYECDSFRDSYLVFLAKASWKVKNLEGAIQVARLTGLPLKVLGSRNWPFQIQRLLTKNRSVEYYGMVNDKEKRTILRKAKALLFPVRWHEPFGLAITEALASGCAVFGTPYGSLPEIINSNCGHLSTNVQELAQAITKKKFEPSLCRKRVTEGFTHIQMAKKYVQYYTHILNQGTLARSPLNPNRPPSETESEALLHWS